MPKKPDDLKRYLFRAWMAYLLGVLLCYILLLVFTPPASHALEYLIVSLLGGLLPGGWYVGYRWIRQQMDEGVIRPHTSDAFNTLAFGMFLFVGPLLYVPAMLFGLVRLLRLARAER